MCTCVYIYIYTHTYTHLSQYFANFLFKYSVCILMFIPMPRTLASNAEVTNRSNQTTLSTYDKSMYMQHHIINVSYAHAQPMISN